MQAELNFDSSSATLKQDEAQQLHLGYLEAEPDLVETSWGISAKASHNQNRTRLVQGCSPDTSGSKPTGAAAPEEGIWQEREGAFS